LRPPLCSFDDRVCSLDGPAGPCHVVGQPGPPLLPTAVGRAVGDLLAATQERFGADSDCTCVARVIEERAGCEISPNRGNKS